MRKIGLTALLSLLALLGLGTVGSSQAQSPARPPRSLPAAPHIPGPGPGPLAGGWSAEFAQGIESLGQVTDVISDGADLYVVGSFDQVQGVAAANIARRDGLGWHAVAPTSPPGLLTDIAVYRDELYVVTASAYRSDSGGLWRYNAATEQWTKIGFPSYENSEQAAGTILELAVFNDRLIVSGDFEQINFTAMPGIAAWDGAAFAAIAPHSPYFYATDLVLDPSGGIVVAGSWIDMQSGERRAYLGRWNGTAWQPLDLPFPTVQALDWADNTLYAFGGTEIKRRSGNQWAHVSTVPQFTTFIGVIDGKPHTRRCDPTCATLFLERWDSDTAAPLANYRINGTYHQSGVAKILAGAVYLGGAYWLADGSKHALLVYRDGTLAGAFDRISSASPALDLDIDQGRLYVASAADFTGPLTATNVMTWQAGAWSRWWATDPQRSPFENAVRHLEVLGHDDLLIAGRNLVISPTVTTALARVTAGSWLDLDPAGTCTAVSTTAYSGTALLAACLTANQTGWEILAGGAGPWTTLATDELEESVASISDIRGLGYHGRLYGLLRVSGPGGAAAESYVYAWSGQQWDIVRVENQLLNALAQSGDDLYAGGATLFRADGAGFTALAATNGQIRAILIDGERIWIGGEFSEVAGVTAHNIALWDGEAWHGLGAGTDGPVYRLAYESGTLAISGDFTRAGGIRANGISLWHESTATYAVFLPAVMR